MNAIAPENRPSLLRRWFGAIVSRCRIGAELLPSREPRTAAHWEPAPTDVALPEMTLPEMALPAVSPRLLGANDARSGEPVRAFEPAQR